MLYIWTNILYIQYTHTLKCFFINRFVTCMREHCGNANFIMKLSNYSFLKIIVYKSTELVSSSHVVWTPEPSLH